MHGYEYVCVMRKMGTETDRGTALREIGTKPEYGPRASVTALALVTETVTACKFLTPHRVSRTVQGKPHRTVEAWPHRKR